MSDEPTQSDLQDDIQSAAMNEQLRSDVASWKASRSEEAARRSEFSVPIVKPPSAKPATRPKAATTVAVAPPSDGGKKKPFGMSYDGMTQADYITYRISRGAR